MRAHGRMTVNKGGVNIGHPRALIKRQKLDARQARVLRETEQYFSMCGVLEDICRKLGCDKSHSPAIFC